MPNPDFVVKSDDDYDYDYEKWPTGVRLIFGLTRHYPRFIEMGMFNRLGGRIAVGIFWQAAPVKVETIGNM